ncbi:hypothetical protein C2G38_2037750 [Gigaspora rosea]|uniref:Protein kinase domain-containing protein n=1 Tax=Gigaspora rosea TaxID=44941 RepID=A0A397VDP5_9GLOM|nr:hypothetical protein C2G38_2037750 [Gigaspora rosea]
METVHIVMKITLGETCGYENVIEWIPLSRLSDVKEIGKGGFGSVYSATWSDGIRKIEEIKKTDKRSRESNSIVALKTLSGSLKEFDNHLKCSWYGRYIHADFHSGNILQDQSVSKALQSYISDLGLSKKVDETDSKDCVYGVMPYVYPDVLSGKSLQKLLIFMALGS